MFVSNTINQIPRLSYRISLVLLVFVSNTINLIPRLCSRNSLYSLKTNYIIPIFPILQFNHPRRLLLPVVL